MLKSGFKIGEFQHQKTTADAARLFNVHPTTISRLLRRKQ